MNFVREKLMKYREIISYSVIGITTTGLNILLYYILTRVIDLKYILATVIAYILAVVYAFFTNKIFVFQSYSFEYSIIVSEATSFFVFRSLMGVVDIFIMYIGVDKLGLYDTYVKVAVNVFVIILNYIFSKWIIFNNKYKACNEGKR